METATVILDPPTPGKLQCAHGPEYDGDCESKPPCQEDPMQDCNDPSSCNPLDCALGAEETSGACGPLIITYEAWCGWADEDTEPCFCDIVPQVPPLQNAIHTVRIPTKLKTGSNLCTFIEDSDQDVNNLIKPLCGGGTSQDPDCGDEGTQSPPNDNGGSDLFDCLTDDCEIDMSQPTGGSTFTKTLKCD